MRRHQDNGVYRAIFVALFFCFLLTTGSMPVVSWGVAAAVSYALTAKLILSASEAIHASLGGNFRKTL